MMQEIWNGKPMLDQLSKLTIIVLLDLNSESASKFDERSLDYTEKLIGILCGDVSFYGKGRSQ